LISYCQDRRLGISELKQSGKKTGVPSGIRTRVAGVKVRVRYDLGVSGPSHQKSAKVEYSQPIPYVPVLTHILNNGYIAFI
jgi:hypothetical protein